MPTSLPPPSPLQSVPLVCLSRATFACRCPRPCLEKWKWLNAVVLTHAVAALSCREEYRQSLMVYLHGRLGEIWATRNATSPLSDKRSSELGSWPCLWVDTERRWWAVRLEENTALSDTRKIQQFWGLLGSAFWAGTDFPTGGLCQQENAFGLTGIRIYNCSICKVICH